LHELELALGIIDGFCASKFVCIIETDPHAQLAAITSAAANTRLFSDP
jgi:hypothetical protein